MATVGFGLVMIMLSALGWFTVIAAGLKDLVTVGGPMTTVRSVAVLFVVSSIPL